MLSFVAPNALEEDVGAFLRQVQRLRLVAAHGAESEKKVQPITAPVCEGLKALCVLYDLITCGSGVDGFECDKLMAQEKFRYNFNNIRKHVKS